MLTIFILDGPLDTAADLVTKRTYIPSLASFEEDIRRAMGIADDVAPSAAAAGAQRSKGKTKIEPHYDSSVDKTERV